MWIFFVFVLSFLATLVITPIFIKKLKSAGVVAVDVHKKDRPKIPEMGGLAVLFGFSVGIFFSIPFFMNELIYLFAAFLVVLITGLIGICDDLFGIKQGKKAWLPIFASVPLIVTQAGVHEMNIPFIGLVNFGVIYPLVLIPLGVAVAANAFNMLAGYNGLESGLGFISCLFVGIAGLLLGKLEVSILMFAMSGACLGFLKFNYFPARIFPGDVGTFTVGSAIAAAVIIGNMETVGVIVLGPYIINGFITVIELLRRKPIKKFSEVKNGFLVPPSKEYVYNLYFLFEKAFKITEKRLVQIFWLLGILFGVVAVLFLYI